MLKKTLMTAAAAAAITAGATAVSAPQANAGVKFHIGFGHYSYHHFHKPVCYTKYKKVKVKIWTKWGPVWKWKVKPVYVCH